MAALALGTALEEMPLERLEAEITELAGHLAAAECRWLLLIAEFDRRRGTSSGASRPARTGSAGTAVSRREQPASAFASGARSKSCRRSPESSRPGA